MSFDEDDDARATAAIYSDILAKPSAKTLLLSKLYKPPHNAHQRFCHHLTLEECTEAQQKGEGTSSEAQDATASLSQPPPPCPHIHFEILPYPQTTPSFGHCSYLSGCHRSSTCKYLHFVPVAHPEAPPFQWKSTNPQLQKNPPPRGDAIALSELAVKHPVTSLTSHGLRSWILPSPTPLYPAQLLSADLKLFDLTVLGKFDVIVQDSAFDIHMSLPYGTMTDADIRAMPIEQLQDEGFIFFWVTGRAMELGRELLRGWGYERVEELVWIKIGQTQRLIRTGRTGHWLNHTKEHCLIGSKSRRHPSSSPSSSPPIPSWAHLGLDSDVLVSEVRDTSRKPDELYGLIERMCPGGRKLELFGRRHNARSGWVTVGNQLRGDVIHDKELQARLDAYRARGGLGAPGNGPAAAAAGHPQASPLAVATR